MNYSSQLSAWAFMIQFKNHVYHKNIQQRKDDRITGGKKELQVLRLSSAIFCYSFSLAASRYQMLSALYWEITLKQNKDEKAQVYIYTLKETLRTCCLACFSGHSGQTHGTIQSLQKAKTNLINQQIRMSFIIPDKASNTDL